MIYRFLSTQPPIKPGEYNWRTLKNWDFARFGGCFYCGCLGMSELKAPSFDNRRAKFYFTEEGFHKHGPEIIAQAKHDGVPLKVIKEKNPSPSRIIYQDRWQLAILPEKKNGKRKNTHKS